MKLIRPQEIVDTVLTSSNVAENDYVAWSSGTTYALGDHVIVTTPDEHRIYESLQGTNIGHTPSTSPTWWLDTGATNRWRMFDNSVSAQTTNANSIAVVFAVSGRVDSVALLNISAAEVQITMTDSVEGVVYDRTIDLVSDSGVQDWYAYFFEPIVRISDLTVSDLPPYADASVAVTLSDSGATVACGECVLGLSKEIGDTQYGARVGIQDYSIKTTDDFGNFTILERAYARRADFTVFVAAGFVDALQTLLASLRATPIVYVGSDEYASTIVFGFFKDFSIAIAYPGVSVCNIEIEGLR